MANTRPGGILLKTFTVYPYYQTAFHSIDFNNSGDKVLTVCTDGSARIFSTDGSLIVNVAGHNGNVFSASFNTEGDKVLAYKLDGSKELWQREQITFKQIISLLDGLHFLNKFKKQVFEIAQEVAEKIKISRFDAVAICLAEYKHAFGGKALEELSMIDVENMKRNVLQAILSGNS